MSSVRRIYVEKKPAYAVAAKDLFENIRDYLWYPHSNWCSCTHSL